MSKPITRRKLITTGLAAAAGASGLAVAARIADRYGLIPANHNGIYGVSETITYAAHRILTSGHSLAREFDRSQISSVIPINGKPPETDAYKKHLADKFVDWRVKIDGLVAKPTSISVEDLQRFPLHSQITHQACEEGWSFIAEWTGARLSDVLQAAGILPQAKYVFFFTVDEWSDSLDIPDALHPQTFLAYGMNGEELPPGHGAPVRLKVARQLGCKSLKFLTRITVTDTAKNIGDGLGSSAPAAGYSWYAGI